MKTAAPSSQNMGTDQAEFSPAERQPAGARLAGRLNRGIWQLSALYLVLGAAWTLGGDWILAHLLAGPALANRLQLASHLLFLALTSLAIYWLLRILVRAALQAHLRLADSEASHREMFQANPHPMLVYDLGALKVLDANPAAVSFFGWPRDTLIGMPVEGLWPQSARKQMEQLLKDVRSAPDQSHVFSTALQSHDGNLHVVDTRSTPLNYRGLATRLVVINDRTAEHEAQQRRDLAVQRLEEAQEIARLGSWEVDRVTGLGLYSSRIYQMLGRQPPPEGYLRHGFDELLVSADLDTQRRIQRILQDLQDDEPVQLDLLLPVRAADGRERMVHLRATSSEDHGAHTIRGTLQDVTEGERSRRLLHEREDQFRELVRVLPDGVAILHQDRVLYANTACAGQFGYLGEALLGEALQTLVVDSDFAHVQEQMSKRRVNGEGRVTARMRRLDGAMFHAGLSFGDVRYSGRDCKLLIVRDLSEPERMRDALAVRNGELHAMARRLFSVQEDERRAISRDLHDDIGQAITAMKLSAHAALEEDDTHKRHEVLHEISHLADATITKLRNLSMLLRPPQLDDLGLEAALRWQAGMLFRASAVRLQMDIATLPSRPSNEVEQACFRIAQESLTNALRHACAGEVRLMLGDDAPGQQLCLEVIDDGDGFDPDGPRGLGLIVMRERAQSAGGTLVIESSPGAGTRVTLCLPYLSSTMPSETQEP